MSKRLHASIVSLIALTLEVLTGCPDALNELDNPASPPTSPVDDADAGDAGGVDGGDSNAPPAEEVIDAGVTTDAGDASIDNSDGADGDAGVTTDGGAIGVADSGAL